MCPKSVQYIDIIGMSVGAIIYLMISIMEHYEIHKRCDQLQEIRNLSKKIAETLKLEHLETTTFSISLTFKNCQNSQTFKDKEQINWIWACFYDENKMFGNQGSDLRFCISVQETSFYSPLCCEM